MLSEWGLLEVWKKKLSSNWRIFNCKRRWWTDMLSFLLIKNFEDYLFNNTKLETPDPERHKFGDVYEEAGKQKKWNLIYKSDLLSSPSNWWHICNSHESTLNQKLQKSHQGQRTADKKIQPILKTKKDYKKASAQQLVNCSWADNAFGVLNALQLYYRGTRKWSFKLPTATN